MLTYWYKAIEIEKEGYLLQVSRYVIFNSVGVKIAEGATKEFNKNKLNISPLAMYVMPE